MNFLILTLIAASPLWVLDFVLRCLRIPPPLWIGDTMAIALLFLGFSIVWKSIRAFPRKGRAQRPARNAVSPPIAPALVESQEARERNLPCLFHEIQNYSCSLRGNALLLRRHHPPESMLEPLDRLERTSEKIECLAREILGTSSINAVTQTKSLDAAALIQGCVQDHFSDAHSAFEVQADAAMPFIQGDCLKLERVFLNLFRNSLEAGARHVRVRLSGLPRGLRILVEDDGQGCAPEHLAKLFQPLYSTKREKGGTGLGLYMVKAILESHGGRIRAVSKNAWGGKQSGMIFCLELPKGESPGSTESHGYPESKMGMKRRKAGQDKDG